MEGYVDVFTLYPWMSPFWVSRGGGSHVTSSWVAVADWMATFRGGAVGTAREGVRKQSFEKKME